MIEVQVGDKLRGFSFGLNSIKLINELSGTKYLEEIFERLKANDLDFISKFMFACAQHYAKAKKQDIDFTEFDVSEWLDELGLAESMRILTELIKTYTIKNLTAPQETGQTEQP